MSRLARGEGGGREKCVSSRCSFRSKVGKRLWGLPLGSFVCPVLVANDDGEKSVEKFVE